MPTWFINIVEQLFFGMLPPEAPEDSSDREYQKAVAKWRRGVVNFNWAHSTVTGIMLVFVFGILLPANWNRVAWAQDVRNEVKTQLDPFNSRVTNVEHKLIELQGQVDRVERKTNAMLLSQLRSELREMRRLQCHAIIAGDSDRKKVYGRDLQDLKDQYRVINSGTPWDQPGCDEV